MKPEKSSLYHEAAYDVTRPVPSYWRDSCETGSVVCPQLDGDTRADVAVIGAGLTGLNAAIRLAGEHNVDVVALDAGYPGWGASGRNAGCCVPGGARRPPKSIANEFGHDELIRFERVKLEAVEHVQSLLEDHNIDADAKPGGEWHLAYKPKDYLALKQDQEYLTTQLGLDAATYPKSALRELGINGPTFHGALHKPQGFGLHPLKYVCGLAGVAHQRGVRLHGHSRVRSIQPVNDGYLLQCETGSVRAARILLATNGYSSEKVPAQMSGRTLPVMSNIIVTRPLSSAEKEAQGWNSYGLAIDTRKLIHYFRLLPDDRFLFGMRAGVDASGASYGKYEARVRKDFEWMFPHWREVEHTHYWAGFVCMARRLLPFIGPVPDLANVWAALAYHGNGVAMGSWSGRHVADRIAGAKTAQDTPAVLRGPLPRFPLPALRRAYLQAVFVGYGVRDYLH